MRKSYGRMSWAHRRIGYDLGYTKKLARLEESIGTNAVIADAIARLAKSEFSEEMDDVHSSLLRLPIAGDLGRVRESLKHFVRDWSSEGCGERDKMFGPILAILRDVQLDKRATTRVLVFTLLANELSFYMNLAFRFLLSGKTTQRAHQHVLQPYSSWFSHQRTTDTVFRSVSFPDVVPRLSDRFVLAEKDFLSIQRPEGSAGFDFVVTLFFIDTSLNVIETLEHIHASCDQAELVKLAQMIGFDVADDRAPEHMRLRTVECEYTADKAAMMKWLYQAEFWVATKKPLQ
ncbi:N2227-like protein-domain-containing protein [Cerioporus squamosus]|nr:N2227-like protein-domain-containing protein [Cerioporus squamosus]